MSRLNDSLDADGTDDSELRDLDESIQVESDPAKRASLFERQNAHLKRTLGAQKQRLRDIKEQELDLASSDLARLQERMEQLAAENRELEKAVGYQSKANGVPKTQTTLPLAPNTPREAPRSVLDVLASESAAYVKKIESLENSAAQLIQRLRMQEEEAAEARRTKQVEALLQENRAFAARIEKFEETTVTAMQREIDALKTDLAAARKQIPPHVPQSAQQAVTAFVDKYSRVVRQAEEEGRLAEEHKKLRAELELHMQRNAELDAQCRRHAAEAEEQGMLRAELEVRCGQLAEEAKEQGRLRVEFEVRCRQEAEEQGRLRAQLEAQQETNKLQLHLEAQLQAQAAHAEEQARLHAELEAQCEQFRNAAAGLEEHNITLAAALKARCNRTTYLMVALQASQLEAEHLRAELAARVAVAAQSAEPTAASTEPPVARHASLTVPVAQISAQQSGSSDGATPSVVHLAEQAETGSDAVPALPVVPTDLEERERVEIQLRALRTALLGLEAENGGLTQDNQRLHNEVAILGAENKRLFEESQLGGNVREEMQALHQLLTETAVQRADLTRFLHDPEKGALDDAFLALLRLLDEYEKFVAARTGHVSDGSQPKSAAALAERHAEELRGLWHHVSSSNRNLLRLLTQQTAEGKSLQEQVQAFRIRNHMLADSSNGLKSALARAATELEEWHNRALSWERERAGLQAERNHWMSLVYAQAKEDLEEHRALLGLASSSISVAGS